MFINQLFHNEPKNKKELLSLIRTLEKHKLINIDTKSMLEGVLNINKKRIKEIMIPHPQMITLNVNYTLNQCLNIIIKSAHSRYPVMNSNKNYVKGFLIVKDLLPFMLNKNQNFFIKNILRPAVVVPESKYVHSMLKEFRLNRYHMAIVIDEFGAVSGLVTIEDVLELIVGNIEDEYDNVNELNIQKINQNIFTIKGLTEIKEFNNFFNSSFNDTEVDTIGGLITKAFGRLPVNGEIIFIENYKFKILKTDSRRILKIQMTIPKNK